jgi:hypothetical protein
MPLTERCGRWTETCHPGRPAASERRAPRAVTRAARARGRCLRW